MISSVSSKRWSARRLGIDGAAIDDVVQDTFVVVHRRLDDFEARSSMKTWLYGILRRVVADHRRAHRRKSAHVAVESLTPSILEDGARAPDACAEQAESVRLLRHVLTQLDPEKREVFVLAELEGMTMVEIGEALEVNPNTVAARLRAARRLFEEALARVTQGQSATEGGLR